MSVVWEDEYDPSELDGFQVETESELLDEDDAASRWLADEYYNIDTQERIERLNEVRA